MWVIIKALFEIIFVMPTVGNLGPMLGCYFELCFVMAKVGNLDANLGGAILNYFL